MGSYFRIFILHAQYLVAHPSRSIVWFLISLINPLVNLAFWIGALTYSKNSLGISMPDITAYYFLLVIAGSMLMVHVEEDVAREDIQQGRLSQYLLKPFSYFLFNFIEEIPYRLLQGGFGILIFIAFVFAGFKLHIAADPSILIGAIIVTILAYFIGFFYKMALGMIAFWYTDIGGLFGFSDILIIIFAGYLMPIWIFPAWLQHITYFLPFSYIIYFPIMAFQGKLIGFDLIRVILAQIAWICFLYLTCRLIWSRGIRKFTALGQ